MNPMITTGIDLVEISRFKDLSPAIRERFFQRVFTENERKSIGNSFQRAAGFFAAKEALVKALGCGIGPVSWHEIEVLKDEAGKPELRLLSQAQVVADQAGISAWSVSITHTRDHAIAMVIGIISQ